MNHPDEPMAYIKAKMEINSLIFGCAQFYRFGWSHLRKIYAEVPVYRFFHQINIIIIIIIMCIYTESRERLSLLR